MRWDKEKEAREFIAEINRVSFHTGDPICRAIGPYIMLKSALEYIQELEDRIERSKPGYR